MRPFQGPITISMLKHTIMAGKITRISHGAKTTITTQDQTIQTTSNIPTIITILPIIKPTFQIHHNSSNYQSNFFSYQQNFSSHAPQSSFQGPPADKKMTDMERNIDNLIKSQTSFMQNQGQ